MRKKITIMLIIVIIINALSPNFIYSTEGVGTLKEVQEHHAAGGGEAVNGIIEENEAEVTPDGGNSRKEGIDLSDNNWAFSGGSITNILMIFPKIVNNVITVIVFFYQETDADYQMNVTDEFTIENLVLGKYTVFNINFFEDSDNATIQIIRKNVSTWYTVMRRLALVIGLFVLIYIGIRMTLSTLAEDKAKYKKMFTSWVTSIILLFLMHYIVIILLNVESIFMELLNGLLDGEGFEEAVVSDSWNSLQAATGFNKVAFLILYSVLVYYQVKFFLMYFKRFLSVGFLIVISPLVTITYSIDKAGDGKAQAFNNWFRQMIFNVFIQLLHAIVYVIFIFSAAEIAKEIPLLGILFLMSLSRAEKIVKTTFTLKGKGVAEEKPLDIFKKK